MIKKMVYINWGENLFVCRKCGKDYWYDADYNEKYNNPILNDGLCSGCVRDEEAAKKANYEPTVDDILTYFTGNISKFRNRMATERKIKPWLVHK